MAYFNGKYAPEAGKTRMRTAFFTRAARNDTGELLHEGIFWHGASFTRAQTTSGR